MSDTPIAANPIDSEGMARLADRSRRIIEGIRRTEFAPDVEKKLHITFPITTAAQMVGRTPEGIRKAESEGRLPAPETNEKNRRIGYTLDEINRMRTVFGTSPYRQPGDPALTLAVQNFKGGVGKSTVSTHIAQALALKGYRVLVIDCDSQASATTMFGFNPDMDFTEEETLYPFFRHGATFDLSPYIIETHWPGIHLIPSNLGLYQAEYEFAARLSKQAPSGENVFARLRKGIESVKELYDVVIIDPPPALGMISIGVLQAADGLIIPVPPSVVDFASTGHFIEMATETLETLSRAYGVEQSFEFIRVLATKVDTGKSAQGDMLDKMGKVFGQDMMKTFMVESAEIDRAARKMCSVLEMTDSSSTHKRCRENLLEIADEVEGLIRSTWPSASQQYTRSVA